MFKLALLAGSLFGAVPEYEDLRREVHCEKLEMNAGDGEESSRQLRLILWVYDEDLGYTISHWVWASAVPDDARLRKTPRGYSLIWVVDGELRAIHAKRVTWTHTPADPEITEQQFDGKSSGDRGLWSDWDQ